MNFVNSNDHIRKPNTLNYRNLLGGSGANYGLSSPPFWLPWLSLRDFFCGVTLPSFLQRC